MILLLWVKGRIKESRIKAKTALDQGVESKPPETVLTEVLRYFRKLTAG